MKLKLPAQTRVWTGRGVHIIELAFILFWVGLAVQSTHLVVASVIIFSYLALALAFQSGISPSVSLRRHLSPERVTEGEMINDQIVIRNGSSTPCLVRATEEFPDGLEVIEGSKSYVALVPPNSLEMVSKILGADFRGHYSLDTPVVIATDELNLRSKRVQDVGKPAYLTVLPPIEDLSDFAISSRTSQPEIGAFRSGSVGIGTEFFGIRDYLPGDDLRRINWKASARSEFLLSNEYEREHVINIYLIADLTSALRDDLKWVVRTSASIATYLLKTRNRLGLIVLGEGVSHVRIESGHRQLLRVLDKLITAEPGGAGEPTPYFRRLLEEMPRCEIFFVSPLRSETIANAGTLVRNIHERVCLITCRDPPSGDSGGSPVRRAAERIRDLKRAAVLHRMKNARVRIIEVPFGVPIRSVASLIEERPIRR